MAKLTVDEKYMKLAIGQAKKAKELGEVPIGCDTPRQDAPVLS